MHCNLALLQNVRDGRKYYSKLNKIEFCLLNMNEDVRMMSAPKTMRKNCSNDFDDDGHDHVCLCIPNTPTPVTVGQIHNEKNNIQDQHNHHCNEENQERL
jgi:hypothetical protein